MASHHFERNHIVMYRANSNIPSSRVYVGHRDNEKTPGSGSFILINLTFRRVSGFLPRSSARGDTRAGLPSHIAAHLPGHRGHFGKAGV